MLSLLARRRDRRCWGRPSRRHLREWKPAATRAVGISRPVARSRSARELRVARGLTEATRCRSARVGNGMPAGSVLSFGRTVRCGLALAHASTCRRRLRRAGDRASAPIAEYGRAAHPPTPRSFAKQIIGRGEIGRQFARVVPPIGTSSRHDGIVGVWHAGKRITCCLLRNGLTAIGVYSTLPAIDRVRNSSGVLPYRMH